MSCPIRRLITDGRPFRLYGKYLGTTTSGSYTFRLRGNTALYRHLRDFTGGQTSVVYYPWYIDAHQNITLIVNSANYRRRTLTVGAWNFFECQFASRLVRTAITCDPQELITIHLIH